MVNGASVKPVTKVSTSYRVEATRVAGKYVLQRGFLVTESRTTSQDTLITAVSESRPLTQAELIDLAKKLGWTIKKPKKLYHLSLNNKLKITSGYVTQNYVKVRDLKL